MKINQIILGNMKIIYAILLLMNFLGDINGKNESKSNNSNFESTFINNRERKLEQENYIIANQIGEATYNSGFGNSFRTNINFIEYNEGQFSSTDNLYIAEGREIKIYFSTDVTSLESFFDSSFDPNVENIISIDLSNFILL